LSKVIAKAKKDTIKVSTPAKRLLTAPPQSTEAAKSTGRGRSTSKVHGLTPKQQALIRAYTNPEKPTYLNGTQSALVAYNTTDPNVAHGIASETLRKPTVQNEIDTILNMIGMGNEVRQTERASIIRHSLLGKTITKRVKDPKTGEVSVEVTRGPAYSTKLKALDQMDKIAGVYNQAELQKELIRPAVQELARTHLKDIKARIRARREDGEGGQGTYSGGDVSLP